MVPELEKESRMVGAVGVCELGKGEQREADRRELDRGEQSRPNGATARKREEFSGNGRGDFGSLRPLNPKTKQNFSFCKNCLEKNTRFTLSCPVGCVRPCSGGVRISNHDKNRFWTLLRVSRRVGQVSASDTCPTQVHETGRSIGASEMISFKWIFRKKFKTGGTLDKHKARLMAKEFKQEKDFDYFDIFAPVTKITSIYFLLPKLLHNLIIYQMDVKTIFLNGYVKEGTCMDRLEWFIKF